MIEIEKINCPNCGAPIITGVCPYCGIAVNIKSNQADMEYPVIECKEAHLNFFNLIFPLIFAISFGFFGFALPFFLFLNAEENLNSVVGFFSIFAVVSIIAWIIVLKSIVKILIIKFKGEEIEGTIYGYMSDTSYYINGVPTQVIKIKINTDEGPRFILYQTGGIKQLYSVNSKIKLKTYKNLYRIVKG